MFIRILIGLIFIYLGFSLFLFFVQEKLLFPSDERPFGNCSEMLKYGALPRTITSLRFYERRLTQSFGSIIYLPGNGGNACDRSSVLKELYELPYDFYFLEYPGYAADESGGPSEKKILQVALELFDFVYSRNSSAPIVIFGESLGSGVATYIASERPQNITGLILQAPYTSMKEVAKFHYPYIPIGFLLKHSFEAGDWAKTLPSSIEVLILRSGNDQTIPPSISESQIKNFSGPLRDVLFPRAGHNDMELVDPENYWDSIADFLENRLINHGRETNEN